MSTPDRILLEGLRFYGYHGVMAEEARLGQEFVVDLSIETNLQTAGVSDKLDRTISYAEIFALVRRIVEDERYNLIEALAETIATKLLAFNPHISAVMVRVTKPNAPIPGLSSGRVAVEIRRERT